MGFYGRRAGCRDGFVTEAGKATGMRIAQRCLGFYHRAGKNIPKLRSDCPRCVCSPIVSAFGLGPKRHGMMAVNHEQTPLP